MRSRLLTRCQAEATASLLPDRVLMRLHRALPSMVDDDGMWSPWIGASYRKWCRRDARTKTWNWTRDTGPWG